jgi:hypothetical protein
MKMRYVITSIVVVALGIGGCDRQAAPAAGNPETATPAAAATTGTGHAAGTASAAPAAAPAAAVGSASVAAPAQAPDPVPEITWREVTIPAGTSLPVILDTSVASDTSSVEAPVAAHLTRAIVIGGVTVVPRGSQVSGVVTDATRAAKVKGRASIGMKFDRLTPEGETERYPIQTRPISRLAPATKKDDTVKILAPAVGGAIIGRIVGGRKGAAIGAGTGAGAGTAVVMGTRGKEVRLGKGAALTLRLVEPLTVRIRS